jgi:alkanesulfonate monooxygenase SsuD/methylene tetrahydromethanopterin reductase-like flavin-dependent oxidoreductase (luciferase family)
MQPIGVLFLPATNIGAGVNIGLLGLGDRYSIDAAIAGASTAAMAGFDAYWLPGEIDPISTITTVGREVPGIALGISVVPVSSRHPVALALEALMTNQAIDGRLVMGIGLSHAPIVEAKWGQPFDKPIRAELRRYRGAGVTDFIAAPFGDEEERGRTISFLRLVAGELS